MLEPVPSSFAHEFQNIIECLLSFSSRSIFDTDHHISLTPLRYPSQNADCQQPNYLPDRRLRADGPRMERWELVAYTFSMVVRLRPRTFLRDSLSSSLLVIPRYALILASCPRREQNQSMVSPSHHSHRYLLRCSIAQASA